MNYPINPDTYLASVREAGINLSEQVEKYYRKTVIPLVNRAYRDGQKNTGAFPMDPEKNVEEFARRTGRTLDDWIRDMLTLLTAWANEAYATGQQDAKEATAV